jgi:hypothetical protein
VDGEARQRFGAAALVAFLGNCHEDCVRTSTDLLRALAAELPADSACAPACPPGRPKDLANLLRRLVIALITVSQVFRGGESPPRGTAIAARELPPIAPCGGREKPGKMTPFCLNRGV